MASRERSGPGPPGARAHSAAARHPTPVARRFHPEPASAGSARGVPQRPRYRRPDRNPVCSGFRRPPRGLRGRDGAPARLGGGDEPGEGARRYRAPALPGRAEPARGLDLARPDARFRRALAHRARRLPQRLGLQRSDTTLLAGLGQDRPPLAVDAGARRRVEARLALSGIRPGRYFVVHPTATLFTKQWQEHKFAELADSLARDFGLAVVFSAARHEEPTLQKIAARAAGSHLYWSDLDLAELFALIDGSSLFIGNDSGPTHAAAALGRPVVVVWGSSNCTAWRPWGSDYELIRSDLPCMPCPGYRCAAFGEPKCILDLQVERVAAACRRIIARHPLYV
ncbi:MAG: hypothetical protein DMG07_17535 [Acidobacteria bacterium]|nr:MAG: hypothetical protein DMG07_17535 [Acidobacteriota bacterium]